MPELKPFITDDPIRDTEWMSGALCQDQPNDLLWFPDPKTPAGSLKQAKSICRACPVQPECLHYAMTHRVYGIWGGLSETERSRLRGPRRSQTPE